MAASPSNFVITTATPLVSEEPEIATTESTLYEIHKHLAASLTPALLAEFMGQLAAIKNEFKGDGAGLSGGILADKLAMAFLSKHVKTFEEHHKAESDCKILAHPLSLKKINGNSTIALSWSKNGEGAKKRDTFVTDIIILNLLTETWWKTAPKGATAEERASKFFNATLPAGIYLVSSEFCKTNVCLSSNNKTDTLIEAIPLYKMLKHALDEKLFLPFPTVAPAYQFDILRAFAPLAPV